MATWWHLSCAMASAMVTWHVESQKYPFSTAACIINGQNIKNIKTWLTA